MGVQVVDQVNYRKKKALIRNQYLIVGYTRI
jgi:hypothetical protein